MPFFLHCVHAEKETQLSRCKFMATLLNEQENLGTTSVTICHMERPLMDAPKRSVISTVIFFLLSAVSVGRAAAQDLPLFVTLPDAQKYKLPIILFCFEPSFSQEGQWDPVVPQSRNTRATHPRLVVNNYNSVWKSFLL